MLDKIKKEIDNKILELRNPKTLSEIEEYISAIMKKSMKCNSHQESYYSLIDDLTSLSLSLREERSIIQTLDSVAKRIDAINK